MPVTIVVCFHPGSMDRDPVGRAFVKGRSELCKMAVGKDDKNALDAAIGRLVRNYASEFGITIIETDQPCEHMQRDIPEDGGCC